MRLFSYAHILCSLFLKTPLPISNPTDPPVAVAQAQSAPLTSSPTPNPTPKPTVPITSYPTTAQPTEPTDNRALNLITGEECVVASGKSQKSSSSKSGSGSSKSGSSSRSRRRGLISQTRRRFLSSNSGSSKSGSGSSKSGSSSKSAKSCKPKASLTWKKKDHAWKVGMKLLRNYRLPPGVPRVNAAGLMYVGDLKVSMLIEDEGMLYEVVSSTLLYAHCTYDSYKYSHILSMLPFTYILTRM